MKTIIAGTDFTPSSYNACKYAAFLAEKLNCKLTIFNLYLSPLLHSNMGLYGLTDLSEKNISAEKITTQLNELKTLHPGLKIAWFISDGGFEKELQNFLKKHQVELAVMGLETKSRFSKFLYGSHGLKIAGKINTPVVIVPEKYKKFRLAEMLLAVDNTEKLRQSSLKSLANIVKQSKTRISMVHIKTPDEIFEVKYPALKMNGIKQMIETLKSKSLEAGIKKYFRAHQTDIIAIISKKHSPLYNFFLESATKKVALSATVPVMSIHE